MNKIWHNGVIKDECEAKISIYDQAMMQGYVFDMTRSFNKKQFKLREHFERLFNSMKYFRLKSTYNIDNLIDACNKLVEINEDMFNKDDEHRLILNCFGGVLSIYEDVPEVVKGTHIMITDIPLKYTVSGMGKLFDIGINACIPSQRCIPSSILDNRIKTHCRLHSLKALIEISNIDGDNNWALLLNHNGYISEFTGANIFIVKDNIIYTPKNDILYGISRNYIINELAPMLNIQIKEIDVLPYDLITADEAFATATPFCMLPITSINNTLINNGKVGDIYSKLLALWSNNVGVDVKKQIQEWDKKYVELQSREGASPYKFKEK